MPSVSSPGKGPQPPHSIHVLHDQNSIKRLLEIMDWHQSVRGAFLRYVDGI